MVPMITLAAQIELIDLQATRIHIAEPRVESGPADPEPKLTP